MIVGPAEPMRVPQAVRPDFLPRTRRRDERIVARDSISPVLAERARGGALVYVRDDSQNFSNQRVEALWILANHRLGFAGPAVTHAHIHHSPFGIAAPGVGVEDQLAHGVNARVQLHTHKLPRGAFERLVLDVDVGPFDQNSFLK